MLLRGLTLPLAPFACVENRPRAHFDPSHVYRVFRALRVSEYLSYKRVLEGSLTRLSRVPELAGAFGVDSVRVGSRKISDRSPSTDAFKPRTIAARSSSTCRVKSSGVALTSAASFNSNRWPAELRANVVQAAERRSAACAAALCQSPAKSIVVASLPLGSGRTAIANATVDSSRPLAACFHSFAKGPGAYSSATFSAFRL